MENNVLLIKDVEEIKRLSFLHREVVLLWELGPSVGFSLGFWRSNAAENEKTVWGRNQWFGPMDEGRLNFTPGLCTKTMILVPFTLQIRFSFFMNLFFLYWSSILLSYLLYLPRWPRCHQSAKCAYGTFSLYQLLLLEMATGRSFLSEWCCYTWKKVAEAGPIFYLVLVLFFADFSSVAVVAAWCPEGERRVTRIFT